MQALRHFNTLLATIIGVNSLRQKPSSISRICASSTVGCERCVEQSPRRRHFARKDPYGVFKFNEKKQV